MALSAAEPEQRVLFVPVRADDCGAVALRYGRAPGGGRVGLAFTTADRAREVLGAAHPLIRLSPVALRQMLRAAGVDRIRLDPDAVVELPARLPAVAA